jgi:hypothetical protein
MLIAEEFDRVQALLGRPGRSLAPASFVPLHRDDTLQPLEKAP